MLTHLGSEVLRTLVYGNMPDVVRRRLGQPWTNRDRAAFTALCGTLRTLGPAIRRGMLAEAYPEGTPHLRPGSHDEIVVAGPNPASGRQPARARSPPATGCRPCAYASPAARACLTAASMRSPIVLSMLRQ